MIDALTLKNYKTFKFLALGQFSPFTLLGGMNDVGKTSILTAIYIYTARLQPAMANLAAMRSQNSPNWAETYFHGFSPSAEKQIEIGVVWSGMRGRVEIQYDPTVQVGALLDSGLQNRLPDPHPSSVLDPGRLAAEFGLMSGDQNLQALRMRWFEGDEQKSDIYWMLPPAKPGMYVKYSLPGLPSPSALLFPFMRELPDAAARSLSELVKVGAAAEITSHIKMLFPHIRDLTPVLTEPGKGTVLADVGLPKPVPISELGEGAKEALNLMLTIPRIRGGVLLCDELGAGIHASILPRFVQSIAATARKYDCQIIATTHSYELLSAAYDAFAQDGMNHEDLTYVRLDRTSPETVLPTVFNYEKLGIALSNDWEVR